VNNKLQEQIRKNLLTQKTEELLEIWQTEDTDKWDESIFEMIKEILLDRLGHLPAQSVKMQISKIFDRVDEHLKNRELAQALNECETAIELAPDFSVAYHYRGVIFDEMGLLEKAITNYQKAIELDPEDENVWGNLLDAEFRLKEEFESSTLKASLDQAHKYANAGEFEKAISECEAIKPNLPSIAIAHNHMGLILQTAKQLELAIDSYARAVKYNPRFYVARENLANARIAWEEEQYHLFSNLSPAEEQEITKTELDEIPESDEPLPEWLYMNEKSRLLMGYPGYRNRQGRSGYDPIERNAEQARMQGMILRLLFTRKFRTRNPIYLIGMALIGTMYSLSGILPFIFGGIKQIFIGITFAPYLMIGIALLTNVYLSLRLRKDSENEDNGYTFF